MTSIMMYNEENTTMRGSQLRPPSRIPASAGLLEMSTSDTNSRSMLPPPGSLKHKATGLPVPEPPPKRKTLAERAGEAHRSIPATSTISRPTSTSFKSSILNGAKPVSLTGSTNGRSNGTSTRNVSNSSNTSSTSYSRPASVIGNIRPPTSFNHARTQSQDVGSIRPATALTSRDEDIDGNDAPTKRKAWDTKGRLEDMETLYSQLKNQFQSAAFEKNGLEESLSLYKTRINELEQIRLQLNNSNRSISDELSDVKIKLSSASLAIDDARRSHNIEIDELTRKHRNHNDDREDAHRKEIERLRREEREAQDRIKRDAQNEVDRLNRLQRDATMEIEKTLKAELDEERSRRHREVQELTTQYSMERQSADVDSSRKEREMDELRRDVDTTKAELDTANAQINHLREKLAQTSADSMTFETSMKAYKAKIDFLESDNQAQSQAFADIHQKLQEAEQRATEAYDKLRVEETLRRKLHNQVQELKGNIRVFCRVRPTLESDVEDKAKIAFPDSDTDSKEVAIQGPEHKSALGNVTATNNAFSFDRVFSPASQNAEIFDEISQLVQSALDGYNVCIFCYGQTGSGKTYTMSSIDGMIPRAVTQIYDTAKSLEEKGWKYTMEGSFIEVYNETLNDLLGKAEDWEKKKHEIKHDPTKLRTTVTDVNTVPLDSPSRVNSILEKAGRNRSVAATKANSRSSRSHSVFILKLTGENSITGEKSEGTLNLVDLAGSERLSHSGATGERMKETQHINKSLSCLGDVIAALGQGKEGGHVPYRNSKLTYLLQYSLGGNSKTLMFVMISPFQAHLGETLTSLKFATKVHNTHIGTAKRQAKVKD